VTCTFTNQARGNIVVKKVTDPSPDPTGTSFGFTSSYGSPFSLTNGGSNDSGPLPIGTYSVGETTPTNWLLTSSTCDDGSDPSSIGLSPGETVTCTFVNQLQVGAITVHKERKNAAQGPGTHPQAGVNFTVNGVTKATDANGNACFDGLFFASYTVHETVPTGYSVDGNDKSVTVNNRASCAGGGGETVNFVNTPLTNLSVNVTSPVPGATSSTIDCGTTGSAGPANDPSLSAPNLAPGTYVCTVVIDP
jgi:hypothetical protein